MKKAISFLSVCLLLFIGTAYAQEQTGDLVGTVVDDEGTPLPGVTVTATSPALIGSQSSITNQDGRFRLMQLPPGEYTVTFELSGFSKVVRKGVEVRLGRTFSLSITMKPATLEEEITVVGESPVVDVTKSASTYEISKEMFNKLPKGRNFTSVITLAGGVNDEDAELDGISFDGASSSENMFYIDGVDTTTLQTGESGQNVMFEYVEEVQVKSSGYQAQYGGSMGGVVNVVTRSGGNEFHGEGVFYFESSALDGEDRPSLRVSPYNPNIASYITYPKDDWYRYEMGLNLGGYLVKDKLWFFASFLPKFQITNRELTFLDEPAQLPSRTNQYTQSRRWDRASIKLTLQPVSNLRMSLSWNDDYYQWRGALPDKDGSDNPNYDYAKEGVNYPGWTGSFNADYIVSDSLFFTVSAGRYFSNRKNIVSPPDKQRYYFYYSNADIPGVPEDMVHSAGYSSMPWTYEQKRDIEAKWTGKVDGTLYVDLAGQHMWKAGIQWNRLRYDRWEGLPRDYYYYLWGLNSYFSPNLGQVPLDNGYMFVIDPYGTIADASSDRIAFYLQDSWTLSDRLTLNLGIRMEKEHLPSFVDPDSELAQEHPSYTEPPMDFGFGEKMAPRLGFAYDVFGNGDLKVFGSYGIYYDVMKLSMAVGLYGGNRWISHYYEIPPFAVQDFRLDDYDHEPGNPPSELAPYYLESLNWRIPSYDTTQPDPEPYSKMEYTLGVQARVAGDVSFTARILHNHIIWAIEDVGVQTPGGETYYCGNPGSDWINEKYADSSAIPEGVECPRAKRRYDSLEVGFDKRFSNNWMAGFHYTLSRLWGNFSGLASSDEHGRQSPNVERYFDMWFLHYTQNYPEESTGPLNTDRPHQFKLYGAYSFDFGMTVGANVYAMTGTPVSTDFGLNGQQGYYPAGRADYGRTPFLWSTDVYAEYNIQVTEKHTIQVNLNITNFTNNRIARRIFNHYNQQGIYLDNETIVSGFDYKQISKEEDLLLDPRYGKKFYFQGPISLRLGVKFIF